ARPTKDETVGPGSVPTKPDGSSHLLSPRLGWAEPTALNSSFSLPGRTTRALDTGSATIAPARSGTRGKPNDPPQCPKGMPGRATSLPASLESVCDNVNWFTQRGLRKRYRHRCARSCAPFCLLALVLMAAAVLIAAPGSVTWALSLIE